MMSLIYLRSEFICDQNLFFDVCFLLSGEVCHQLISRLFTPRALLAKASEMSKDLGKEGKISPCERAYCREAQSLIKQGKDLLEMLDREKASLILYTTVL